VFEEVPVASKRSTVTETMEELDEKFADKVKLYRPSMDLK